MIHFHTSTSEIEELKQTIPNFQLILNALDEHSEIELIIEELAVDNSINSTQLDQQ